MTPRKPEWLRKRITESPRKNEVLALLRAQNLNTVCQGARCPNLSECFGRGTATFLLMGSVCTRGCRFCAVDKGAPQPLDPGEPLRVARAIAELKLKHAVITSVTRDDLPDGGAAHFAAVVTALRENTPDTVIEILTPDFQGDTHVLSLFVGQPPDIFNHNLETVPSLYAAVRPQASYDRSLGLLNAVKKALPSALTKSGLMVGLGETIGEVHAVMGDLRRNECDILSIGQYLAPSADHTPVREYVTPEQFAQYAEFAKTIGFKAVFSGPFVRSSYLADGLPVPAAKTEQYSTV